MFEKLIDKMKGSKYLDYLKYNVDPSEYFVYTDNETSGDTMYKILTK